jgi:nitrogen regulatory protein PII
MATVTDASGLGTLPGRTEIYDVICAVAFTGAMSDGKIWVTAVGELVRIRIRELGRDAL